MTILFVTPDKVNPQCGGISRVTYTLAEGLNDIGIRCGSVYVRQESSCHSDSNIFYCSILLKNEDKTNQWNELINTQKVDFIIVQGGSSLLNQELKYIREAIDSQTRPLQLFYVFHSMPGYELYFLDWSFLVRKIFSKDWIKYLKQLFIQMMMLVNKSFLQKRLYKKYQIPCKYADKIILLSEAYIEDYNLLTQGKNRFKYVAIPNLLTYHSVNNNLSNKEKEVLIVARMDEQSKRIKLALRIWAMIPEELLKIGWKLTIVGDGEDLQFYKNFVHINKIKNVSFEGQQDPLPYYQSASIFMMTSAFEGWPMTLMEAMQNGCVPIVYDSFKAVYDIMENEKDGIIVQDGNMNKYVDRLVQLMKNSDQRNKMSEACIEHSQQFSQERITQMWLKLFEYNGSE